jgi:hypothetical protein
MVMPWSAWVYITHERKNQVSKITNGWHMRVEWKYGTTSWEHLADLKEGNHVEVIKYAASNNIHDALAFIWWVLHVLKKLCIISANVTKRCTTSLPASLVLKSQRVKTNWKSMYGDMHEFLPSGAPTPLMVRRLMCACLLTLIVLVIIHKPFKTLIVYPST